MEMQSPSYERSEISHISYRVMQDRVWMSNKCLNVKDDKTEVIVFQSDSNVVLGDLISFL